MSVSEQRLVVLDIDGTVMRHDGVIDPSIRDAVAQVVEAGHLLTLATGRSVDSTLPVLGELGIHPDYVVCSNGAVVLRTDGAGGYEREVVETFDPTEMLLLIRSALPGGLFAIEDAVGAFWCTDQLPRNTLDGRTHIVSFDDLLRVPAVRVVVISPEMAADEFLRVVDSIGLSHVSYAIGWTSWLDLAPEGVHKAHALDGVLRRLQVPLSRVVVAGDGRNDIEMLSWAAAGGGVSAAMGQAPVEVRAVANRVLDPVEHNGLAALLREVAEMPVRRR